MNFERTVLIYRDELLGASETFIPAQAESLRHFRPFYLGLRRIPGLPLPQGRFHFISRDGLALPTRATLWHWHGRSKFRSWLPSTVTTLP
jgi:hypothetical protein